jgi:hypothetical protein
MVHLSYIELFHKEQAQEKHVVIDKDQKVKQVLTKELQLYYEQIVLGVMDSNLKVRQSALMGVESDPGIQGLMPYFVQFITDTVIWSNEGYEKSFKLYCYVDHAQIYSSFAYKPRFVL